MSFNIMIMIIMIMIIIMIQDGSCINIVSISTAGHLTRLKK